ncbi:MAG TPA: class I SAM-dependent methyltransferase [Anaerolineales bacterium]|nr:class I SAM-dependent methyltransferase [Anaerolineales bacterium]
MLRKLFFILAYMRHPIWDTGVSPQELLDFITSHPPGKALDMGCGTGTNVITLAKHGWLVTGVDFTRGAIRVAKQKAQQHQVKVDLQVDDVTHLKNVTGKFDLILDMGCFHSLPEGKRQMYISNVERLLADEGTFLLYTFIQTKLDGIGAGVEEADLLYLDQNLHIVHRKNGTERGIRASAWLTIQKKGS